MGRRLLTVTTLVAILVVAFWLLSRRLFDEPSPPPRTVFQPVRVTAPQGPEVDSRQRARVVEVDGKVERSALGQAWVPVQQGDELDTDDSVRTDKDGRLLLDVGGVGNVEVAANSRIGLRDISRTLARLRVEDGRVRAEVRTDAGARLSIEGSQSDAVAESTQGEFFVMSNGQGEFAVASRRGLVRVSAKNKTVEVTEGQQSVVKKGLPPAAPLAIPPSLYLKVNRPASLVQREKTTSITGQTAPGAVVSINGVRVETDESGAFTASIPLEDGKNQLKVEALDATGRKQASALPDIVVKSEVSEVRGTVNWARPKDSEGRGPP